MEEGSELRDEGKSGEMGGDNQQQQGDTSAGAELVQQFVFVFHAYQPIHSAQLKPSEMDGPCD